MKIFVTKDGKQEGPFTKGQIESRVICGLLSTTDLCWHSDIDGWIPIAQLLNPTLPEAHFSKETDSPEVLFANPLREAKVKIPKAFQRLKQNSRTQEVAVIVGYFLAVWSMLPLFAPLAIWIGGWIERTGNVKDGLRIKALAACFMIVGILLFLLALQFNSRTESDGIRAWKAYNEH
jgi:hypothetical protein